MRSNCLISFLSLEYNRPPFTDLEACDDGRRV